jgi:hypothetical protein
VKARQEAGGRRQEKNNYGIKTGFSIIQNLVYLELSILTVIFPKKKPGVRIVLTYLFPFN